MIRWQELDTFDPADVELLFQQDEILQASESYPGPTLTVYEITHKSDDDLGHFLLDIRNALKLPLSDGFLAGMTCVAEIAEGEAKERLNKREKLLRRQRNGEVTWETFDLLGAVREVTGEAGKQKGDEWWFRCPFHDDRNPSFEVNAVKRTWHCWAQCGAGGVVDFKKRIGL